MGAGRLYCLAHHWNQQLARRNRSERTIATDLIGVRQADAFLRANGTILEAATRADPMRRRKRPIVPDKPVLSVPRRSTGLGDP